MTYVSGCGKDEMKRTPKYQALLGAIDAYGAAQYCDDNLTPAATAAGTREKLEEAIWAFVQEHEDASAFVCATAQRIYAKLTVADYCGKLLNGDLTHNDMAVVAYDAAHALLAERTRRKSQVSPK